MEGSTLKMNLTQEYFDDCLMDLIINDEPMLFVDMIERFNLEGFVGSCSFSISTNGELNKEISGHQYFDYFDYDSDENTLSFINTDTYEEGGYNISSFTIPIDEINGISGRIDENDEDFFDLDIHLFGEHSISLCWCC